MTKFLMCNLLYVYYKCIIFYPKTYIDIYQSEYS